MWLMWWSSSYLTNLLNQQTGRPNIDLFINTSVWAVLSNHPAGFHNHSSRQSLRRFPRDNRWKYLHNVLHCDFLLSGHNKAVTKLFTLCRYVSAWRFRSYFAMWVNNMLNGERWFCDRNYNWWIWQTKWCYFLSHRSYIAQFHPQVAGIFAKHFANTAEIYRIKMIRLAFESGLFIAFVCIFPTGIWKSGFSASLGFFLSAVALNIHKFLISF